MGQAINEAFAPVGIRPFSGGPYPDRGEGDKALSSAASLKKTGTDLLGTGESGLFDLFGLKTPGAATGPTGGATSATPWGASDGGPAKNPYGLSPTDMGAFNLAAGPINAARKTALESATAGLSARGLSASGAKALKQYIDQAAETDLSGKYMETVQASFQRKLQTFLQMLQMGSGMLGQDIGAHQNAAQSATAATNQGHSDLFSAIAAGFQGANALGGGGGGSKQPFDMSTIFG